MNSGLPFANGGTVRLRTRRKFTPAECSFVTKCFNEGKSPRETAEIMQCGVRVVQTRYEILRGRGRDRSRNPRSEAKVVPLCVIAECEERRLDGRRTCERHAKPTLPPSPFSSFIPALTEAQRMVRRA